MVNKNERTYTHNRKTTFDTDFSMNNKKKQQNAAGNKKSLRQNMILPFLEFRYNQNENIFA